ncbi:hypothetical protein LTR09_007184 [Extremus antarcticus]|uniref:Uncharacterized protein n=1 Tax=Extremus antarcticus TaxID=702011 RepID=A0AAJ0DD42_9PEZI|nr:hypothetical protein LTR09_007184 [Extremus antarcticus]
MARTYFEWNQEELKERITVVKAHLTTLTGVEWPKPAEEVNLPEESADQETDDDEDLAEELGGAEVAEHVEGATIEPENEEQVRQTDDSGIAVKADENSSVVPVETDDIDTDDIDTVDSIFEGSADELGSDYSRAKLKANIEKIRAKLVALGAEVSKKRGRPKGWKKVKDGRVVTKVKEGRVTKKAGRRGKKVARGDEGD